MLQARNIDYGRRVVPWSGLGTDITDCTTIADALWKAGLDWTVVQKPIQTSELFPVELDGFKANIRDYDNAPLGIVSTSLQPVKGRFTYLRSPLTALSFSAWW